VTDAVIEPRRDASLDTERVKGDRLWVATGSEVRAYDLTTRDLAGTLTLPDAVALAYDRSQHLLYVGTRGGEIRIVDTEDLDATRRGPPAAVDSRDWMDIGAPIAKLTISRDQSRLLATLTPGYGSEDPTRSTVVVIDAEGVFEMERPSFRNITQISSGTDGRIFVATEDGLAIIDQEAGTVAEVLDLGGPVHGVVGINDIENDPIYATVATPEGPKVAVVIAKSGEDPKIDRTYTLPGATAGRAYYDLAARMVHIEGSVPEPRPGLAINSSAAPGAPTV
jgi:hypothetical protein